MSLIGPVMPEFVTTDRYPWMADAGCRDTDSDLFFAEDTSGVVEARAICNSCPVRLQCLEYAVAQDVRWGVFGGLTARERRGTASWDRPVRAS